MNFLREDLTHLFDDKGIDQSQYDDVVRTRSAHVLQYCAGCWLQHLLN